MIRCEGSFINVSRNAVPCSGDNIHFQELHLLHSEYFLFQTSDRLFVIDNNLKVKWDGIDTLCNMFPYLCVESCESPYHKDSLEWRNFVNFGSWDAIIDAPIPLACNWHFDPQNKQLNVFFKTSNTDSVKLCYVLE